MNRFMKIGLYGLSAMTLITLLLYSLAGVSLRLLVPFFLPWAVLLLIGITNRKR